eukprot:TRINITY_DN33482_c0_g2_i1.p2 TRINITY_DN33482_c0_g2~~TRINITY_DN33482_c0_g2_i1.p2  ORF type:complete len:153 (+),score=10.40 TRINITY_DN33482_c0_g2_i1:226-684(+)
METRGAGRQMKRKAKKTKNLRRAWMGRIAAARQNQNQAKEKRSPRLRESRPRVWNAQQKESVLVVAAVWIHWSLPFRQFVFCLSLLRRVRLLRLVGLVSCVRLSLDGRLGVLWLSPNLGFGVLLYFSVRIGWQIAAFVNRLQSPLHHATAQP